jgi:hypothetical protein
LGQTIEIGVDEKSAQSVHELSEEEARRKNRFWIGYPVKEYSYTPTGVLAFRILGLEYRDIRKTWKDGKTRKLEDLVKATIVGIIDAAVDARCRELERAEAARIRAEDERRRLEEARIEAERQELIRKEQERVKLLQFQMERWELAQRLRAFINAAQRRAVEEHLPVERGTLFGEWIAWESIVADLNDPLIKGFPDVLLDSNANTKFK